MEKSKMYMVALAQELLLRANEDVTPSKEIQEQITTIELHKMYSENVLHPSALLYGLGRTDLVDVVELFCKWFAHVDDRVEIDQTSLSMLIAKMEYKYGALEGIEKVFVNQANNFIRK